jgi:hypothetical protein
LTYWIPSTISKITKNSFANTQNTKIGVGNANTHKQEIEIEIEIEIETFISHGTLLEFSTIRFHTILVLCGYSISTIMC